MTNAIEKLWTSFENNGIGETAKLITKNLGYEVRWYLDRAFDRRYGTDTSGRIELETLDVQSKNRQHGIYYEATSTRLFRHIMSKVLNKYSNIQDSVFVDFGSGKGRVLLLASQYPFKEIIGVEFSQTLHQIAQRNTSVYKSRHQKCFAVESLCVDATEYQLPKDNLVLYFYNPFSQTVMSEVMKTIEKSLISNPRRILILYFNPLSSHIIEASRFFTAPEEIKLPHDYTRTQQRRCFMYSNVDLIGVDA